MLCVLLVALAFFLPLQHNDLTIHRHKTITFTLFSIEAMMLRPPGRRTEKKLMHLVPKQEKAFVNNGYTRHALVNAMAAFTIAILMPTTGLCSAMGQVWPLVLMGGAVMAGTIFGLLLHKKLNHETVIQIPFTHVPNVPRTNIGHNVKKAA